MNVTFECPYCHASSRADVATAETPAVTCSACSREIALRSDAVAGPRLVACPLCGTRDLYMQKDFPQRLGLTIVGIGTALSCVAWYQYKYPHAIAILLVTAFIDLCLYYAIGEVLVCYRCLAQIRGTERNPEHQLFDLGIGERYRQEKIRLETLRKSGSSNSDRPNSA